MKKVSWRSQTELREAAATLRRVANDLDEEADQMSRSSQVYNNIVIQARTMVGYGMTDLVAFVTDDQRSELLETVPEYLNWSEDHVRGARYIASVATDYGDVRVARHFGDEKPLVFGRKKR